MKICRFYVDKLLLDKPPNDVKYVVMFIAVYKDRPSNIVIKTDDIFQIMPESNFVVVALPCMDDDRKHEITNDLLRTDEYINYRRYSEFPFGRYREIDVGLPNRILELYNAIQ